MLTEVGARSDAGAETSKSDTIAERDEEQRRRVPTSASPLSDDGREECHDRCVVDPCRDGEGHEAKAEKAAAGACTMIKAQALVSVSGAMSK